MGRGTQYRLMASYYTKKNPAGAGFGNLVEGKLKLYGAKAIVRNRLYFYIYLVRTCTMFGLLIRSL